MKNKATIGPLRPRAGYVTDTNTGRNVPNKAKVTNNRPFIKGEEGVIKSRVVK